MKSIEPFAGSFMFHPSTMPEANLASHIRILLEFARLLPNCQYHAPRACLCLKILIEMENAWKEEAQQA
jgi:hypothetical protein